MSSNGTIHTAASQYASRPKDERFPSLEALIENARTEKEHSGEVTYNAKSLFVTPARKDGQGFSADNYDRTTGADTLTLQSPKSSAEFTHWSFGQLCRSVGAPANYLRNLPPVIAADALNYGLTHTPPASDLKILVRGQNGQPPVIRACTSESYGRVWDADLFTQVAREVTSSDSRWQLPPTWEGDRAGAYRGDRDSFLILVNGGSIVNDPSAMNVGQGGNGTTNQGSGQDGGMYRGIMIRNSEVGAASITIETVLYRYICGNHILWGAAIDTRFRRRHVGTKAQRDTIREISRIAYQYTTSSTSRDEAIIKNLIAKEIATTKEAVIDELRGFGASKEDAERAYQVCEQTENASPRSFWGAVQGLTRASQEEGYQDTRYILDQIAAKVLAKGAKLVTA